MRSKTHDSIKGTNKPLLNKEHNHPIFIHLGEKIYHISKCSMKPLLNSVTLGVEYSWLFVVKNSIRKGFLIAWNMVINC